MGLTHGNFKPGIKFTHNRNRCQRLKGQVVISLKLSFLSLFTEDVCSTECFQNVLFLVSAFQSRLFMYFVPVTNDTMSYAGTREYLIHGVLLPATVNICEKEIENWP